MVGWRLLFLVCRVLGVVGVYVLLCGGCGGVLFAFFVVVCVRVVCSLLCGACSGCLFIAWCLLVSGNCRFFCSLCVVRGYALCIGCCYSCPGFVLAFVSEGVCCLAASAFLLCVVCWVVYVVVSRSLFVVCCF